MSSNYYVIFRGEVAEGFGVDEVKNNIASILEEDEDAIEDLFSGRTLVIRRDPDLAQCERLRDVFLSIGAVCYIRDSEGQTQEYADTKPANPLPPKKSSETTSSGENTGEAENIVRKLATKLSDISAQSRQTLHDTKDSTLQKWETASDAIKSDMEIGGIKLLLKNKYFFIPLGMTVVVAVLLFSLLTYERKAMPSNEENFTKLIDHIEFIEHAFTLEELENMTKDPKDFLDYLLADPIKKMGYEFEASIEDISDKYLGNDFSPAELQKIKNYLEITAHERSKLHELGFISEKIKKKLDNVAQKLGK